MATTQNILVRSVSRDPELALRDIGQCVTIERAVGWGSEAVPSHVFRADSIGLLTDLVDLGYVLVAEDVASGEIVGFARATFTSDAEKHWLHELAVHPQFQGMGIGLKLMMGIRRHAQQSATTTILFTFDPFNAGNGRLYLNACGARGIRVIANLYGRTRHVTRGDLHTHRLLAYWDLFQGNAALNCYDPGEVRLVTSADEIKPGRPCAVAIPSSAEAIGEQSLPDLQAEPFSILRDAINTMGFEAVGVELVGRETVPSMVLVPRSSGANEILKEE
jgi:predicted GNAT superfamily acetyltransferase